ncbi:hypothetical protein [Pedobacter mendelii]|uniref:Uncharacterized protein n=1 Tax=Pedobacter mendelii TaxID=1908240 RepID=A0ABQ2BP29_9SPHI|nr:hypothetical protein [Pedobacter mendelii]GGI29187.1 hypothetical protein GCM10008119_36390 [Pedobacter mendelii]
MSTEIKNIRLVSAEDLFETLKINFADYLNKKLDSEVMVEFARVYDIIDVSFPEIIVGIAFHIVVSEKEIILSTDNTIPANNSQVLEKQLTDFLELNLN